MANESNEQKTNSIHFHLASWPKISTHAIRWGFGLGLGIFAGEEGFHAIDVCQSMASLDPMVLATPLLPRWFKVG